MMCFRQVETKHVQNANDHVKLSGNPEVEAKIGDQIAYQLESIGYISRGNHEVIVDVTIQDEVDHPSEDPLDSGLINLVLLLVIVRSAKGTVIYDGKERKDNVWQQKEIGKCAGYGRLCLTMLEVIHVYDQPEHKHRGQNRPDDIQPGGLYPPCPQYNQCQAGHEQDRDPGLIRDGEVTDSDETKTNSN